MEDAPAGNWVLLGTNGSLNYGEDGVVINPEETIDEFYVLGSTAAQKARRAQERFSFTVMLYDLTAEHFARVINGATVTTTAPGSGAAGVRDFDLLRGADVAELAALLRSDQSPYITVAKSQFWVPRAYVASVGELTYAKDVPVGMEVEFAALEHSTNGFGKYEAQDLQGP